MSEGTSYKPNNSNRRRKVQALLAGGTVLGVGALITLANWTDEEFASGVFGGSSFNLEGSITGADDDFADNNPAEGAIDLEFAGDATNMVPEQTVYAPFWVRLSDETTVGGSIEAGGITVVDEASGPNADFMSFEVHHGMAACDADSVSEDTLVASGETLNAVDANPVAIDLTANEEDGVAGEEELLCFAVTADDEGFLPGQAAEVTWQVQATSDDEG